MIHLPHPAIAHLPAGTMLVSCLHNLFSLPATTPTPFQLVARQLFEPFHCTTNFSTAVTLHTYSPIKMEQTQCSETLVFKLQTLGNNNPEENI
jgi:hypothetical protein